MYIYFLMCQFCIIHIAIENKSCLYSSLIVHNRIFRILKMFIKLNSGKELLHKMHGNIQPFPKNRVYETW